MSRTILIGIGLLLQATTMLRAQEVRVAAAISLKESLTQIAVEYERETKIKVRFTFGGSGELAAQIEHGAPIDLFISAAQDLIDQLAKAEVVDGESRVIVARNRLVLVVPADTKDPPRNFEEGIKTGRLAIGHPKSVPAGRYAQQVLASYNLANRTDVIHASNVRQVLDWVERGEVSAGFVYHTDALISGDKVKVVATADESRHDPIVYPAVVIKNSANVSAASALLSFIKSERGQAILTAKGFLAAQ